MTSGHSPSAQAQEYPAALLYRLLKQILRGYLHLFSLTSVVSGAYPPPAGPKIIAANHPNATDSFFLPFVLPDQLHFVLKEEFFSNPATRRLFLGASQIQARSSDGKATFDEACAVLNLGGTIVIYPEGKLNPYYANFGTRGGAIRLSLQTGVPIIPLGIYVPPGCLVDLRRARRGYLTPWFWQISGRCFLRFGRAWWPATAACRSLPTAAHALTRELMNSIYGLVAQISAEEE